MILLYLIGNKLTGQNLYQQSGASVPLAFCLRQIRRGGKMTGTVVLLFTEIEPYLVLVGQ
jgi:hypothetical protein